MKRFLPVFVILFLLASAAWAGEKKSLEDQKDKDSYSLGYEFARSLVNQEVDVNEDVLLAAVRDGLAKREPALSTDEIGDTLRRLRQKVAIVQDRRIREQAAKNLEEGAAFLRKNKLKDSVKTLASGLQYRVLKEGSGTSPKATDRVMVRYRGTLIDGTEFDNSDRRDVQAAVPVTGVNRGWTEALQLMKTGSRWQIFVPADLGYGPRQYGRIPPNSVLVFDLELLSIAGDPASMVDNTNE
jgi:FKBP-type peptidyl-prolyl cis-trans isomerase FklB